VIRKGLAAGDRVIVDNLLKLRPGAPVQPMAAVPAASATAQQTTPAKAAEDKSAPVAGKANN
jgi:membrane fusion protein (multidrug efflux system)